ncbi:MarR family winged helix-turn-helix transcriptional regulator [Paenibacillus sp. LPE1-1-1.1]|uniref:MarR family winged helix-turn-helix transcriptional regulator n=1 Tax=Paenibacillus sp. LPE1-1-1.1 TaxID=3135230 RepID=UPI00343BE210
MDAQTRYKSGKYHRNAKMKHRSQRSKYRVLGILMERGTVTSGELAVLLMMPAPSVSKVTQSLTVSGLIARAEKDGQFMAITDNGVRVWEEANRDWQKWLERYPDLVFNQEPEPSNGANAG